MLSLHDTVQRLRSLEIQEVSQNIHRTLTIPSKILVLLIQLMLSSLSLILLFMVVLSLSLLLFVSLVRLSGFFIQKTSGLISPHNVWKLCFRAISRGSGLLSPMISVLFIPSTISALLMTSLERLSRKKMQGACRSSRF